MNSNRPVRESDRGLRNSLDDISRAHAYFAPFSRVAFTGKQNVFVSGVQLWLDMRVDGGRERVT